MNTTRFLKHVWPFFNIMKYKIKTLKVRPYFLVTISNSSRIPQQRFPRNVQAMKDQLMFPLTQGYGFMVSKNNTRKCFMYIYLDIALVSSRNYPFSTYQNFCKKPTFLTQSLYAHVCAPIREYFINVQDGWLPIVTLERSSIIFLLPSFWALNKF